MSSRSLCVLNAGSSSLKFALYRVAPDGAPQRAMSGEA
jgi:acetate kinase